MNLPSRDHPGGVAADIRYVTDVPYIAGFTAELAPEWLDLVATINGFAAPARADGFAWCELGCGPGMAPIIFAATHPEGEFHGIDAMPDHIARGEAVASRAGIGNLTLHALDFETACGRDLPQFDYITAHGVYAWIDETAAASLRRFIERHLKPGGLVYISYNSMPGWASDGPFQHLLYALAEDGAGDSIARFAAAAEAAEKLREAGAAALAASPTAVGFKDERAKRPEAYFAHEYLCPAWRPRYVDEVRRDMAAIGLSPVGSATLRDNFDSFVLRAKAREALEAIADPDRRELARDYFMFQRFRRDVFGLSPRPLDDDERRAGLFATTFALLRPPSLVEYKMTTEAGDLAFDNPVARGLVAKLGAGPRRLQDCLEPGADAQDLLANTLSLCCSGAVRPVAARAAPVDRLNTVLLEALDANNETTFRVMPHGTALRFDGQILVALRDGKPLPDKVAPWVEFLNRVG
ncbi:class I SAM-dependent methyltransferase [Dongia sp.]|uniref:class I SAM-dependent methyltransferase n=1 Tax=Dongia sp. TaxID=1977262 RepID=UPI003751103C